MMAIERAEMKLAGALNQIRADQQPLGEGRREMFDDRDVRKVPGQWQQLAVDTLVAIGERIDFFGCLRAGVAVDFDRRFDAERAALVHQPESHADGVAAGRIMIAELDINVTSPGLFVLLEQSAEFVRLGGRKVAHDDKAVLLREFTVPGRGLVGEAIKAGVLHSRDLALQRPRFFRRRGIAQGPEIGDVTEKGLAGSSGSHIGAGGSLSSKTGAA
jgi:hypothetical protein